MIRIDSATRLLQVKLDGAVTTRQIPVFVSYVDRMVMPYNGAPIYDGSTKITNTNDATAVNVCIPHKDNPLNTIRDIDSVVINNVDTVAATVTVQMLDSATVYIIIKAVLAVGDMLVYSHDGGWQCLDSNGNIKFASTGAASQNFAANTLTCANEIVSPNLHDKEYVINGGAMVQQGAVGTLSNTATYGKVDMYLAHIANGTSITGTIGQSGPGNVNTSGYIPFVTGSWTAGQAVMSHRTEGNDTVELNGQKIIVQVKVWHDFGSATDFLMQVRKANTLNNFGSVTTLGTTASISCGNATFTLLSLPITMGASDGTNGLEIFVYESTAATRVSKNFGLADVSLRKGTTVQALSFRPYAQEEAICQRYFEKSFGAGTEPAQNAGAAGATSFMFGRSGASSSYHTIAFKVRKFSTPTMIYYNPSAANAQVRDLGNANDCTSTASVTVGTACVYMTTVSSSSGVAGFPGAVHWTAACRL